MRALIQTRSVRSSSSTIVKSAQTNLTSAIPHLRSRSPAALPAGWGNQQRATYYFDASRQSVKTLRVLLAECQSGADRLGLRPPLQLLVQSIETLLQSVCPSLEGDAQSRDHFLKLLCMHLRGLSACELQTLTGLLQSQRFGCTVTESIVDDKCLREFGFANGPPHTCRRTLLQTTEFFNLLDDLQRQAAESDNQASLTSLTIAPSQACAARAWLATCAASWPNAARPLDALHDAARELCTILDMPTAFQSVQASVLPTSASMVEEQNQRLLIEPAVVAQLEFDENGKLFASVLRDLLELMLAKKCFGVQQTPQQLGFLQRRCLLEALDQIMDHSSPAAADCRLQAQAHAVMLEAERFGRVQIMPTIGAALGHAWIAPVLSVTPDTTHLGIKTGTRFVHSGFQLSSRASPVREWPIRFLAEKENELIYPAARGWHLPVPVCQPHLEAAAHAVIQEWKERGLPYRFIGTKPGVEPTGCRITVWQAVQRGMSADARVLFQHYNRGLPEPDSPTELWLRLNGMMRWLEQISQPDAAHSL